MIDETICDEALKRWARTADGRLFYVKLQKVVMGLPTQAKSGALRVNHGRRSLALEIMAVMAEGMVEDSGGGSGGAGTDDRPVIFHIDRPAVAVPRQRGAKRRVADRRGPEPNPTE